MKQRSDEKARWLPCITLLLVAALTTPLASADRGQDPVDAATSATLGSDVLQEAQEQATTQAVDLLHFAGDQVPPFPTSQSSPTSPGGETWETGGSGWTLGGLWHISMRRSVSPTHSIYYGQASTGDYDVGTTSGSATSSSFTVPSSATLSFQSWYQTESGTSYDKKLVEIKPSGGSWTTLAQMTHTQNVWMGQSMSLSSYAGQSVQLRFHFDSVDNVANGYEGWYVDDIQVSAGADVTAPAITGISSSTHSSSTTWYNKNTASFSWTATDFGGSGVSHYSHHIGSGSPSCTDNDGSTASTSYSIGGLSTGTHTFKVRAIDNAGNCGNVASYAFKVDSTTPGIDFRDPRPDEIVADARQTVTVTYHDDHAGINADFVEFFVDNINRTNDVNNGLGPDATGFTYTPDIAWSSGSHTLKVVVVDKAEGTANKIVSSWSFTYSPTSAGGGGSGPGGGAGGGQCLVENRGLAVDGFCEDNVWMHGDVDRLFGQVQFNVGLFGCQAVNFQCDQGPWN